MARDAGSRILCAGLTLRLKPIKTDVAGDSGAVRTFVMDVQPNALSAAAAIKDMLAHDPTEVEAEHAMLFRDPETGRKITCTKAATLVKRLLSEAGFLELATGLHSFRAGEGGDGLC